jgi:N-acetylglucosaminyldiphosphoundecaprenol N-acetyl-beta-D-mannosaminyltransferase
MTSLAPRLSTAEAAIPPADVVSILGVSVANVTKREAIALMDAWIRGYDGRGRAVFIANAHTLNLAHEDATYRRILNSADVVFGDGAGVRLAVRLRGVRMKDNLVGTDLMPLFLRAKRKRGYRYFLLGGAPGVPERAVARVEQTIPGVQIVGHHHGYLDEAESRAVVAQINACAPDLLLVAMGNPRQERWIHDHLDKLLVPVSVGVGGLVDHWAGNLRRAPLWVRRRGIEWVQLLLQQPRKWRRYMLGNPKFVFRALSDAHASRSS